MLHLQLVRRKHLFLLELLLVSTVLHCVVFLFLFVFYSGYRYSTKIVVRRSCVQIVPTFLLQSETVQNQSSMNCHTNQKINAKKVQSTTLRKVEQEKKNFSIQKKQQTTQKQKEESKKKPTQKNQQQKQKLKQEIKQTPQKNQTRKEKTISKKASIKQEEQKIVEHTKMNASSAQSILPIAAQDTIITDIDDSDTIQIQNYIQREVSRIWHPPIGLPDDIVCYVKVHISSDGTVVETKIEESSGILVYDLSARSAATCLSLPRWAWGKEFTISFRYE